MFSEVCYIALFETVLEYHNDVAITNIELVALFPFAIQSQTNILFAILSHQMCEDINSSLIT